MLVLQGMKNWMASKDFLMLVNFHSSLKNIVQATELCTSNFKLIAIYCG